MSQANRIYNYYSQTCGLGPEYFKDYLIGTACRPPLEFYYKLYEQDGETPVYSFTQHTTDNGLYSGIVTLFGTNKNYKTFNTNELFSFLGTKIPSKTIATGVNIPSVYHEVINLQVEPFDDNSIVGTSKYFDESTELETTKKIIEYSVTIATGIFNGYNKITLFTNNDDPQYTRKVVISQFN